MNLSVPMYPVSSSAEVAMGYDTAPGILYIQFKNGLTYKYKNVPLPLYQILWDLNAVNLMLLEQGVPKISFGSTFHYLIRLHPEMYPFTRLEEPTPQAPAAPPALPAVLPFPEAKGTEEVLQELKNRHQQLKDQQGQLP